MRLFLNNWKLILAALAVCAFFALAWICNERGKAIDSMKVTIATLAADKEQCAKDKKLTEETSHAYQNDLASLADKLNAIKLRKPTRCVMPAPSASTRHNAAPSAGKPIDPNGIATDALYDIAGDGEKYRIQLEACQGFINEVYERE